MCAAKSEKVTSYGSLNEFTACSNSPLPSKRYCTAHMNEKSGDSDVRLDIGIMTRAKRKELGLDLDFLTTTEGCRKREAITVRSKRSKTAGMLYAIRSCGIVLGHMECIHAEEATNVLSSDDSLEQHNFFFLYSSSLKIKWDIKLSVLHWGFPVQIKIWTKLSKGTKIIQKIWLCLKFGDSMNRKGPSNINWLYKFQFKQS